MESGEAELELVYRVIDSADAAESCRAAKAPRNRVVQDSSDIGSGVGYLVSFLPFGGRERFGYSVVERHHAVRNLRAKFADLNQAGVFCCFPGIAINLRLARVRNAPLPEDFWICGCRFNFDSACAHVGERFI